MPGSSTTRHIGDTAWPVAQATGCFWARASQGVWYGLPFGAAVWGAGYVVFPLLGVYQPIWKYDLKTLEKDLSAHLVFGTATAAAFPILSHFEMSNITRRLP